MYIGQTKRNLETRTEEHFRNLRLNHQLTIASHFWNTRHEINNTANILKSVNKKNELITWEKIFIHKHAHHIMNFEVPLVSSLIRKYICRQRIDGTNQHRHNARYFGRFELRMDKTCLKQLSSGKQITLV